MDPVVLKDQQALFDEVAAQTGTLLPVSVRKKVQDLTGTIVTGYEPHTVIRHAVTRYRIRLLCVSCETSGGRIRSGSGYQWCTRQQLADLPLSTTSRKFATLLWK